MRAIQHYKVVGDTLVICASAGELTEESLGPTAQLHRSGMVKRAVVMSLGATTVSPVARKAAAEAMGDHPTLVITDSAIARGMITALSWLGSKISVASPANARERVEEFLPDSAEAEDVLERYMS